jgi:hypothetical protein
MEINFEELMTKKSEEGLNDYLTNIDKYVPEAIYAAISELKKRGRKFYRRRITNDKRKNSEQDYDSKERERGDKIIYRVGQEQSDGHDGSRILYSKSDLGVFSIFFCYLWSCFTCQQHRRQKSKVDSDRLWNTIYHCSNLDSRLFSSKYRTDISRQRRWIVSTYIIVLEQVFGAGH